MTHRFSAVDSALVVVDVQNDFCHSEGTMAWRGRNVRGAQAAVENIARLLEEARAAGVPVVFVRTAHDDEVDSPAWQHRFTAGIGAEFSPARPNCVTGSWGAEFFRLAPLKTEPVVVKHRYSAFSTDEFPAVLAELGRPSLIFVGVATNVCVDSTARDAVDRDYFASLITDACAAYRPEEHDASIACFAEHFGAVIGTEELIAHWASGKREGTMQA